MNNIRLDVHVILLGDENPEWLSTCVQSLAGQPVSVNFIVGHYGHIGEGRFAGYSMGAHPYVGYVDPDDYVTPGAFQECINALEKNPEVDGVSTKYLEITDKGLRPYKNNLRHVVYRRSFVEPLLGEVKRERLVPERVLEERAKVIDLDIVGYVYRNRPDSPAKRLHREFFEKKYRFIPRGG